MKLLITGATGQLGAYVLESHRIDNLKVTAWGGRSGGVRGGLRTRPIDLTDLGLVRRELDAADPGVVLHLGAVSRADEAYRDEARALQVNATATAEIADWVVQHGRRMVFTSTDLVFDGAVSCIARRTWPIPCWLMAGRNARPSDFWKGCRVC